MNAKFISECPDCLSIIKRGQEIKWEKGKTARHAKCPNTLVTSVYIKPPKGEMDTGDWTGKDGMQLLINYLKQLKTEYKNLPDAEWPLFHANVKFWNA